jgi:hypothetical protein
MHAAELDLANRALVYNYLGSAAAYTARVLRTHGNDPERAKDAEAYAKAISDQDWIRKSYGWAGKLGPKLGLGSVGGIVSGAGFGILKMFRDAGQAGATVDMGPFLAKLATTGVAVYLLRGLVIAGGHAGKAISEAWTEMLRSADGAKRVIANLDAAETAFYSALRVGRPTRFWVNAAGPGVALVVMAAIALPVALAFYFLFSSFSATTSRSPKVRAY